MSKKKIKISSIGRIVLLIIISLFIGTKIYGWNAKTLAGNAMPMPFGWGISVVLSGSMEPTLSINELVIVKEQSNYNIGDIVVYQDGSMLIIHRIISIDGDEIITQGDANNSPDDPINLFMIKGKSVAHIPVVGVLARFLKTPAGLILIIIGAILLFELPYLSERKKTDEKLEKIKEEIRRLKDE